MDALNSATVLLNEWGRAFCEFGTRMFIQSSLLIGLLLLLDLCLRGRVSARFRYAMWLLVPVKLVLPPSLALPTGVTYWLGRYLPVAGAVSNPANQPLSAVPPGYVDLVGNLGAMPAGIVETAAPGATSVPLLWPAWVLLGGIAGAILLSVLVLRQVASARRSLCRSYPARRDVMALLQECRADLRISTQVELRLTGDVRSPAVCGFVRPVILLPAVLPPQVGQQGLRTVLAHELTHIKRRDPWVSLVQTILQVVYFWHPLVWIANMKLRDLRESAVDETVLAAFRSEAQCYTDTLIDIAEMAFRKPAFSVRLIGIAESRKNLERRITHMLSRHIPKRPALGLPGLLALVVIGAVLLPMGRPATTARANPEAIQSVPALPEGIASMFKLTKDDILQAFGEPDHIFYGDQSYTLENLPETYYMPYKDISFCVHEDAVVGITLLSPSYVFGNGLRVGDSEEKVKRALGSDCRLEETEFKRFLGYEGLGLVFEIDQQDRSVMEINIERDYGTPARLRGYAHADEFAAQLPQKIAHLDIDTADLKQVITTFGQPMRYIWGPEILPADKLPNRFIAVYPSGFRVFMMDDRIVELRHEQGSQYAYAGTLRVGSTLDEALAVLGPPAKTVEGKPIDWSDANVLFKDIEGREGHCYYHRPDRKVRVWFADDKVIAIYMTRSDYSSGGSEPFDAEFASLLPERIATLDIETAGPDRVRAIFGEPSRYVWGNQTFKPDALPDNYIMTYPCSFNVWLREGRIMEIRHGRASEYAYGGKLRIGSTLPEALDVLGAPVATVTGQKNEFKDGVLYWDVEGNEGQGYYHRSDQKVRVFLWEGKVIAIYMTRSDFPAGG
ncbi:MAG: M56 family metallopeptidase [Sedimentisphaerales bacterium]|nr:M56 family metallopeptidase [Sedimentisphaerales bacterium]